MERRVAVWQYQFENIVGENSGRRGIRVVYT